MNKKLQGPHQPQTTDYSRSNGYPANLTINASDGGAGPRNAQPAYTPAWCASFSVASEITGLEFAFSVTQDCEPNNTRVGARAKRIGRIFIHQVFMLQVIEK
jgi:hypothetical protein